MPNANASAKIEGENYEPKYEQPIDPNAAQIGVIEGQEVVVDNTVYCTCGGAGTGPMVCCDNPNCAVQWYHYDCIGYKEDDYGPSDQFFCCQECKEEAKKLQSKEKEKQKEGTAEKKEKKKKKK